MLTLFTIFIAIVGAGLAFWFFNKRQVKNLAEQIEDKNAVINALKQHVEETSTPVETVVEIKVEKKKKYNNKPKKSSQSAEPKQQPKQNSEKKNKPFKQRKPKPQQ